MAPNLPNMAARQESATMMFALAADETDEVQFAQWLRESVANG